MCRGVGGLRMEEEGVGVEGGLNGIPLPSLRLTRKSCLEGGGVAFRGSGLKLDVVRGMW